MLRQYILLCLSSLLILACSEDQDQTNNSPTNNTTACVDMHVATEDQSTKDQSTEDQSTEDQSTEDQSTAKDMMVVINPPMDMMMPMQDQSTNPTPMSSGSRFDGIYIAAFQSEGLKTALSRFKITNQQVSGDLINRFGENFQITGEVQADGTVTFPMLVGDQGSRITATAKINGQIVEGSYQVGDRSGSFAGALDNQATSKLSIEFDGFYELSFIRDDDEVASTILEIRDGRFAVRVVNDDGMSFEGRGFISEDGTLVLDNGKSAQFTIIAEALLDVETGKIEGLYSVGPKVGLIIGKRAD